MTPTDIQRLIEFQVQEGDRIPGIPVGTVPVVGLGAPPG
jgi:hypothetical protein